VPFHQYKKIEFLLKSQIDSNKEEDERGGGDGGGGT